MEVQVEKKGRKEAIQEICTACMCYIYYIYKSAPTCEPSKIPHTSRATYENTSPILHRPDSSVKPLVLNLWDSHI